MSLPAYQIVVINPATGLVSALFDASSFYDLRYSRFLNDIGLIAITFPSTADIRAVFVLDAFIEVYRADNAGVLQKEETYLCRYTDRFIQDDEERFVVGGVSLNHLLARRIVDPDDDPAAVAGHSVKSGTADQVIYDYVNEQLGPAASFGRSIPGLTLAPVAGIGGTVSDSLRFEILYGQVQQYAQVGAVDFWIERTTANLMVFHVGVFGTDKSFTTNDPLSLSWVGLDPLRGNLTEPNLQWDRKDERNQVYELGQGQGEDRVLFKLASFAVIDSPFNRHEFVDDSRQIEKTDIASLALLGGKALQAHMAPREFTFKPTGTEPGNIYHVDWELGDAVTVLWDETQQDVRIRRVEITISEAGEVINVMVDNLFTFPGP